MSRSAAMEGRGAPVAPESSGAATEMASAAARGVERRREVRDVPVEAATALSGRKRKRDAGPVEGDGTPPVVERRSAAPVQQPAVAPTPPPLQRLLDACHAVFGVSRAPPMAAAVPFIRGIMDTIGPGDVGLRDEIRFFHMMNARALQNPPIITRKTIHQCNNFTIAVFFLPLRAVMALHDHPGMTVFSRLLIGSARLEAYDWVRPRVMGTRGPWMLAEKVRDHDVTAATRTWMLFPDAGGNVRRLVAAEEEHCAFLDVLTPPYATAEGRRCAYYQDVPYEPGVANDGQRRRLAWLQEVPKPRNLRIARLPFGGC